MFFNQRPHCLLLANASYERGQLDRQILLEITERFEWRKITAQLWMGELKNVL